MTTGKIKKNKARYNSFVMLKSHLKIPKPKDLRTLKDDEQ